MQEFLQINPLTLPSLPLTERRKLPKLPAVYFALATSGEVLYIGRSKNLAARWALHHRYVELETIGNIRIAWLHCSDESLLHKIEDALIKDFLPALNHTQIKYRKPRQKNEGREKLIEIIKLARGSMSQRAFGKLLGISATAVQLWESGVNVPDTENLAKIAARSGYKLDDLLACLTGKQVPESSDIAQILRQIKFMPLSQVAMILQAAAERVAVDVESGLIK